MLLIPTPLWQEKSPSLGKHRLISGQPAVPHSSLWSANPMRWPWVFCTRTSCMHQLVQNYNYWDVMRWCCWIWGRIVLYWVGLSLPPRKALIHSFPIVCGTTSPYPQVENHCLRCSPSEGFPNSHFEVQSCTWAVEKYVKGNEWGWSKEEVFYSNVN